MFLRYGNYDHDPGECSVVIQREGVFSAGGSAEGVRERWNIQGRLQAASQSAITTAINNLESAYIKQGQDISLRTDAGAATSHAMKSSALQGGTRVVMPPSFPVGDGAEYSTFRNYAIGVEGFWPDTKTGLLTWGETFNWTGTGGPIWRYLQGVSGPPERQQVQQASTAILVQSGVAEGKFNYPVPSAPILPSYEHQERRRITRVLPANNLGRWRVTWSYTFETRLPIVGLPSTRATNF